MNEHIDFVADVHRFHNELSNHLRELSAILKFSCVLR